MDDGAASRPSGDPLGLPEAEMRRLGYWMVDQVVEHFQSGHEQPAVQTATPVELRAALGGEVPIAPGDPLAAMQLLVDVALANMQHGDHPRYFSRVPGPASFAGVLGEWLGTGFNAIAASWKGGSGPATVELVVLDWLRELLGLPEGSEGVGRAAARWPTRPPWRPPGGPRATASPTCPIRPTPRSRAGCWRWASRPRWCA
jgi:hypothetical protein